MHMDRQLTPGICERKVPGSSHVDARFFFFRVLDLISYSLHRFAIAMSSLKFHFLTPLYSPLPPSFSPSFSPSLSSSLSSSLPPSLPPSLSLPLPLSDRTYTGRPRESSRKPVPLAPRQHQQHRLQEQSGEVLPSEETPDADAQFSRVFQCQRDSHSLH